MQAKLLGAVDTVTSVAQAGDDVAVLVQVVILGAQVDIHIGVSLVQGLDAFRSGDQADELDPLCAVLLNLVMASMALPPVASMGSSTSTSRSAIS